MAGEPWTSVSERLAALQRSDAFSGIARVTTGDRTLAELCHGWADRGHPVPVTPATRFGLASMSKMFTALGVLDAVRRGELGLQTPAVDVLPTARRPASLTGGVTIHHLLTHSSGIADYAEEDAELPGYVADYASLWRDLPSYRMEGVDDFLPLYRHRPPVAAPGAAFHYNNSGYLLLGAVLEEVSGQEFVAAVTTRVLEPLGMRDSGYFRLDEPTPDLAIGYSRTTDPTAPWRSNLFSIPVVGGGDGGAQATARDIDRCLRAIASGALLGPELRDQMLTPHVVAGAGVGMGYGVFVRADGAFGHGGGDPGVETLARHYPARDTSVVLLTNTDAPLDDAWNLVIAAALST